MPKRQRTGPKSFKKRATKRLRLGVKVRPKSVVKPKRSVALGLGFPKTMTVTHKYREVITYSGGAGGAMQTYLFSCNGMYDPNISGTGHQPLYFDQLAVLYDHYVVIGSKIKYKIINTSATPCAIVGFINDDTSVTPALVQNVAEQSTAGSLRMLNGSGIDSGISMGLKWSAKKYFKGSILANTELQGTTAANPTEQSYFALCIQAADLTTAFTTVIEVQLEYIAVWKELKDIASS